MNVLVLFGPSGAGKTAIQNHLEVRHPELVGRAVSHTTRKMRPGEADGKQYNFETRETFQAKINNGEFVEHVEYDGNLYGSSVSSIRKACLGDRVCVQVLEPQGCIHYKKLAQAGVMRVLFVHVQAPPEILIARLEMEGRNTTSRREDMRNMAEFASTFAADRLTITNTDPLESVVVRLKKYVNAFADDVYHRP